jgi:uncharacterized protein YjbI with pentapeptide repeats
MANEEHLAILRQGAEAWNAWRRKHLPLFIKPYLVGADLHTAYLPKVDLHWTDLRKINLRGVNLVGANFSQADLSFADLRGADLRAANLDEADLTGATLFRADLIRGTLRRANLSTANLGLADLRKVDLNEADLTEANLQSAVLVGANLVDANLTGCRVHGLSAWDLNLKGAIQKDLIITRQGQPEITVDNLEVAQFVYLLLHNEKIRDVIDTIGKKGVLLLGRFTGGRLAVLERLRDELRKRDFLPMVFNFDKPETKDFTETVRLLAGLSSFVIADITNPRSAPLELQATVPECMIPFVTVLEEGQEPFAMFQDLWVKHRDWVFAPVGYAAVDELVQGLDLLIKRAQARSAELMARKAETVRVERMRDLLGEAGP